MAGHKKVLFKEKHPELLKFFTNISDLDDVFIGDKRKFEVQCFKGHRKPLLLKSLIKEKRVTCEYCFGRSVYPISEEQKKISLGLIKGEVDRLRVDLWAKYPTIANQLVNPEQGFTVRSSSVKELDFICPIGHIYKNKVNTKTSINPNCGYCTGKKLWPISEEQFHYSVTKQLDKIDNKRNDYLSKHPEIIDFLVNPKEACVTSSRTIVEVWCKKKLHRNLKPLAKMHQCGYCNGKKVFELSDEDIEIILNGDNSHLFDERNDLYKYSPEQSHLLEDVRQAFKVTRNQKIDLDCVCSKGHKWSIPSTTYIKSGCNQCSSLTYSKPKLKFTEKYSELLQYWDYENNKSNPFKISTKREDKFYWICSRCDDSFERCVRNQFESVDKICKPCALKEAGELRRIAALDRIGRLSDKYPEIAKEYSESNEVSLERIHIKTHFRALWDCTVCNYSWRALIEVRVNGGGKCPRCTGKILIKDVNDLATIAPELIKDWDEDYDPSEVKARSSKMAKWKCSTCGYRWSTPIKHRAKAGNGCMECYKSSKRTKGHQAISDFIENLGYSVINDARPLKNSQMEIDVFIPELNIGIEYNGDYWHSDRVVKSRLGITAEDRHKDKLLHAENSGMALAYVWESDWLENQELIKESIVKLLKDNIMPPILRKLSTAESFNFTSDEKLAARKASNYFKPIRNLSEEQYDLFKERYLKGENPASIGEDLKFNIHNLYKLIKENSLVEERLKLGFTKNGSKTLPLDLYEDFKNDYRRLSKSEILKKYKISNGVLMKLATDLGLVSKSHYKSLKS